MIAHRAPAIGWGALLAATAASAWLPPAAGLLIAVATIALLGLPHGAADLELVPPARRGGFLAAYLLAVAAVAIGWAAAPTTALAGFVALSAVHFGRDARPAYGRGGGWAVGIAIVAGPAIVHHAAVAALFAGAGADAGAAAPGAAALRLAGIAALPFAALAVATARPGAVPRPVALAALALMLLVPPVPGFAIGFVALHAHAGTVARQRALGLPGLPAYLRRVAPVLAGAAGTLALVVLLVPPSPAHARALFVTLAALAVPHMLVTPLWRSVQWPTKPRGASPVARSAIAPASAGSAPPAVQASVIDMRRLRGS